MINFSKVSVRLLIVDPIAFRGGSKIATESMLSLLPYDNVELHVLTTDASSWLNDRYHCHRIWEPERLSKQTQGLPFFIHHLVLLINIIFLIIRVGPIHILFAASGPGVDLNLYWFKKIFKIPLIQMIHGPVAESKTIGQCLLLADRVFYLQSTLESIYAAIHRFNSTVQTQELKHLHTFVNGIVAEHWPKPTQQSEAVVFWAASLLKWKCLSLFQLALKNLDTGVNIPAHICYIKPRQTQLGICQRDLSLFNVSWYESPANLDDIRAQCSIFVSSSKNEPFGLSVLEAMAAGLVIVIPRDGAYWDQVLEDGVHCLKYSPDDANDLAQKLCYLYLNEKKRTQMGKNIMQYAQRYQAEKCYRQIIDVVHDLSRGTRVMRKTLSNI